MFLTWIEVNLPKNGNKLKGNCPNNQTWVEIPENETFIKKDTLQTIQPGLKSRRQPASI